MSVRNTPAEVARAVFSALERSDWDVFASMFDLDERARFCDKQLAILAALADYQSNFFGGVSGGFAGLAIPEKPDPIALQCHADTPIRFFRGNPTLRELAAMSPTRFMSECLTIMNEGPDAASLQRQRSARRSILGAVKEGEGLTHVVYKVDGESSPLWCAPWETSTLSVKRDLERRWRVLPNQDLRLWSGMTQPLIR